MENVFVDMGPEISSQDSSNQIMNKPKRSAFVFITTKVDNSSLALEDLRKIDAIKEVYLSYGAYDIVTKVSGES